MQLHHCLERKKKRKEERKLKKQKSLGIDVLSYGNLSCSQSSQHVENIGFLGKVTILTDRAYVFDCLLLWMDGCSQYDCLL